MRFTHRDISRKFILSGHETCRKCKKEQKGSDFRRTKSHDSKLIKFIYKFTVIFKYRECHL